MPKLSEQYRIKAVACEMRAVEANEPAIKTAWTEIAIEWHAIAFGLQRMLNRMSGLQVSAAASSRSRRKYKNHVAARQMDLPKMPVSNDHSFHRQAATKNLRPRDLRATARPR
jgi:hypothetical protein